MILITDQSPISNEANGDDQQGKKQGGTDFARGGAYGLPALVLIELRPLLSRHMFNVFVSVFDHNDGAVHHGANGNGNPT